MELVLRSWRSTWESVVFETRTGRGKTRWLRRASKVSAGWARKDDRTWYAVWSNGTDLIFQAASTQLQMTSAYQCWNHSDGKRRVFRVRDSKLTLIEVAYDTIAHRADPTFDATDLEMEDFFVWACGIWNDDKWRRNILESLSPSLAP